MRTLALDCRLDDPDLAYRALIEAHRGLSDEQSAALNTRLVLILANEVGDAGLLAQAIALARACALPDGAPAEGGIANRESF